MSARGRNTRITHTERFASALAAAGGVAALAVQSYAVNPGMNNCFPWLCDVANRFDKYKFTSLQFRYVPNSPTNLAGMVTLAFDFAANDPAPTTMEDATTYHDYVSAPIWQEAQLKVDLANGDRLPQKDTRAGAPSTNDMNTYDVGNLYVLINGVATSSIVGYLEVIYTVDLMIHQVQSGVAGLGVSTAGLTQSKLVGTNFTPDPQAVLPVVATSDSTFTFVQPWQGIVSVTLVGTVFSAALNAAGSATNEILSSAFPAAALTNVGYYRVKASTGQTFIPGTTATTVSSATYLFASGDYNQFGL